MKENSFISKIFEEKRIINISAVHTHTKKMIELFPFQFEKVGQKSAKFEK